MTLARVIIVPTLNDHLAMGRAGTSNNVG